MVKNPPSNAGNAASIFDGELRSLMPRGKPLSLCVLEPVLHNKRSLRTALRNRDPRVARQKPGSQAWKTDWKGRKYPLTSTILARILGAKGRRDLNNSLRRDKPVWQWRKPRQVYRLKKGQ